MKTANRPFETDLRKRASPTCSAGLFVVSSGIPWDFGGHKRCNGNTAQVDNPRDRSTSLILRNEAWRSIAQALLILTAAIYINSLLCFDFFVVLCGFDPHINQIHTKRRGAVSSRGCVGIARNDSAASSVRWQAALRGVAAEESR